MTEEMDEWEEILQDFLVESGDILENLPTDILTLETNPEDKDQLNKIFRSFHTIKGSAGFLGLANLANFTHKLEDLLNKLRRFEMPVTPDIVDVILEATDSVKAIVESVRETKKDDIDLQSVLAKLEALGSSKEAPPVTVPTEESPPVPEVQVPVSEDIPAPDPPPEEKKIGEMLVEEKVITPDQLEEALEAQTVSPKLGEILVNQGAAPKEKVEAALAKQPVKDKAPEQTIRVDVGRLDNLLNQVGELVLSRNRLSQLHRQIADLPVPEATLSAIGETINQIAFNTTEMQMGVMRTRMLPIARVFNKFHRLIRELEKQTGKPIRLNITGEETELDKTIIEEIGDPLIHLIRNSVDHGIEPPDERIALKKDPQGNLHLLAAHQGNQIVIEIHDDGRGINIQRILERAMANGLITEEKLAQMSEGEILDLIFMPGFSTAEKVSDISGRGVGMDVVKNKITQLKGIIELETRPGRGSTVRLKLPLTLAIIQVLLVEVARQIYAIPLTSVVESLRAHPEEIYSVDGCDVVEFRGRMVPLVHVAEAYNIAREETVPDETVTDDMPVNNWVFIVIVGLGEKLRGMVVDQFVAQEEIVIKSLTHFLSMVKGFAGCTIMGDGKVSLILDIEHLMKD